MEGEKGRTHLSSAHVPLIVEPELRQGVVSGEGLNHRHDALSTHVVGLYVEAGDGRVFPQHLGDGQRHSVVGSGVRDAKDPNVCVGPQRFSKSN